MRRRSRPTFEVDHLRRVLICRILGGAQSPGIAVDRHYVVVTARARTDRRDDSQNDLW